jgi:transposase
MINKYSTFDLRVKAVSAYFDKKMQLTTIARVFNIHRITLYRWIKRYRIRKHINGLQRLPGSGRPCIVKGEHAKKFYKIVLKPASKFGYESDFWTCRRLIQTMNEKFKLTVSQPTMWRLLRELKLTYQKPEKRYFEASKKKRSKWLLETIPQI